MAAIEEELTLLGSVGSPFVIKVEIALKLKGIEYKYVEEKLGNLSETLLNYNPIYRMVPVLVHKGKPISESRLILEYIDETWNQNPILSSDPYQRALDRFWSKFIDDKCVVPAAKTIFIPDEKEREKAIEELYEALQFLENELKDKFFGGDKIGFVDIDALFIPLFQEVAEKQLFTSDKFPKLHKWSQDFYNHPVVKETMPSKEQQFAYFKARAASLAAPSK
ncbi:unnamed protein product [Trifolium pratense]|uniref:Uncharacterized protein n=1 Tax=Trifolium pratense TaxID=57577 RepID=A0ACB0LM10_TRIPR|nr:unnamed protein product [Trifolium pratense]